MEIQPLTWIAAALNAGFSGGNIRFAKNQTAKVSVAGFTNADIDVPANGVIFNLPIKYRSIGTQYIVLLRGNTTYQGIINSDGRVMVSTSMPSGALAIVSTDFTAEA